MLSAERFPATSESVEDAVDATSRAALRARPSSRFSDLPFNTSLLTVLTVVETVDGVMRSAERRRYRGIRPVHSVWGCGHLIPPRRDHLTPFCTGRPRVSTGTAGLLVNNPQVLHNCGNSGEPVVHGRCRPFPGTPKRPGEASCRRMLHHGDGRPIAPGDHRARLSGSDSSA